MAYAPTLTVTVDENPAPRCLVVFSSLADGTQTVNVQRVVEGRTFKVRGGVNLYAVGGASVMDYEVALGVPSSYRAEMVSATGVSLGFTDAASVTVDPGLPDTSYAWVSQPLNPSLAVRVPLDAGTADGMVNALPGDVFYAEGASVGTSIGSRRQGVSGMPLILSRLSFTDADVFRGMFGDYVTDYPSTVLVRTVPPGRMQRVLFARVQQLSESVDYVNSRVTFALTVDEVAPPYPGLVIPLLRRADIDAAYATRGDRSAAYATRLERDTDYSLAGLAG